MGDTVLELVDVTKRFGAVTAVAGATGAVHRGELVTFLGPSGCGKTTLLRLVGGFLEADGGSILLEGKPLHGVPPHRRDTAMVFQNYALFPHLSVADNVAYGLKARRLPRGEITARVEELLKTVQLEGFGERRPHQLSGGQQQRVALARALSIQPKVLLLDEPLSNLDAALRVAMRAEIRRLQTALHLTVILVTHDQEEAISMSDRIAIMRHGRFEQVGSPLDVYESPATEFVATFIGRVNLIPGRLSPGPEPSHATFDTWFGTLTLRAPASPLGGSSNSSEVRAVIRPERVLLALPREPLPRNTFRGEVAESTYTGQVVRYTVLLQGKPLRVDAWDPVRVGRFPEGSAVAVQFPEALHLLPAEG
ncbi:MAG: ABC transporter ATP-binding protein [candidate division NC10 bacterium]|nr:ABC transporter ATP-binding protein [candidate division NC10 bacterium]